MSQQPPNDAGIAYVYHVITEDLYNAMHNNSKIALTAYLSEMINGCIQRSNPGSQALIYNPFSQPRQANVFRYLLLFMKYQYLDSFDDAVYRTGNLNPHM